MSPSGKWLSAEGKQIAAREEQHLTAILTGDGPDLTPCCARCIRGTRAIPGPCGYNGACRCHTRRTTDG